MRLLLAAACLFCTLTVPIHAYDLPDVQIRPRPAAVPPKHDDCEGACATLRAQEAAEAYRKAHPPTQCGPFGCLTPMMQGDHEDIRDLREAEAERVRKEWRDAGIVMGLASLAVAACVGLVFLRRRAIEKRTWVARMMSRSAQSPAAGNP